MNKEKIEKDSTVTLLKCICENEKIATIRLVGGAVIDLLEGRVPKDYDLMCWYTDDREKLVKHLNQFGFIFMYETATSKTYAKGKVKIQFLKTNLGGFDFTISTATYDLYKGDIEIDEECFEKKILIPTSFDDKKAALNSLSRLPHWIKKGYRIKNATYFSLLNCLNDSSITNIQRYPFQS